MNFSRYLWVVCLIFFGIKPGIGQTLGGNAVYNFLKLPGSPQLTALGGLTTSNLSRDIALSAHNPALLRDEMHGQLLASFNLFYAGMKNMHAMAGYHHEPWKTNFTAAINYFHYGDAIQTDPSGNVLGSFRGNDYTVSVSASRQYLERWHYGATIKFIGSNYGMYTSYGLALDFGLNYIDTANLLQIGFVAKNMGLQLKTYAGTGEDLPFDLQIGITKRLLKAPLQFSFTAQRLHQFDILYRDTTFNIDNYGNPGKSGFITKLFRHFVFAAQGYIGEKVELTVGYNVLRQAELSIQNTNNGLTGFSFGAGVLLKKMQVRYARSQYQNGVGYNQFGLNVELGK
jgi:hypothetical protein